MEIKVLYIESSLTLAECIEQAEELFPCFIESEPVEMNYVEISINARAEDMPSIERIFAPLV